MPQDIARLKQTPAIKVIEGAENRTIFIGMDQLRDELLYSDVKGKNPFKDVRVRQALYHAIDIEAIKKAVMRGSSDPTGSIIQRAGATAGLRRRTSACRTTRRGEEAAGRGRLSERLRGHARLPEQPLHQRRGDLQGAGGDVGEARAQGVIERDAARDLLPEDPEARHALYLLGWGVPTFDALYSLQSLPMTVGKGGDGNFNLGRVSNPEFDKLVEAIKGEVDAKKRNQMIADALMLHNKQVMHIPLHNQVIPWAMRKNVNVVHRADNRLEVQWVKID